MFKKLARFRSSPVGVLPKINWSKPAALLAAGSLVAVTAPVHAGGTIAIDDTKWVSVGAGLRTSFNAVEDAAPSGDDYSKDFQLDSVRLYINGQIHENIKFTFNTERQDNGSGDDDIRSLDVIAQFEFMPTFNVWAGRFLPPSDRINLDGPYYLTSWNFPLVQAYPSIFAGRDDGVAIWGDTAFGDTQFKYQVGASQGCADNGSCNTGANDEDNLLYSGRFTLNFWDAEPGYYNSSTYYGGKDILSLGLVVQSQSDAVGTVANQADFLGWNVDGLMEKKLGNDGVVTLEGAYYDFDLDDAAVTGSLIEGSSYFAQAAYLFPQQFAIGKFQPYLQISNLDPDNGSEVDKWEAGVNYVIDGHNARISAVVGNIDPDGANDTNFFTMGVQLQI
jgi:hypothetical protein